jgi:hypothetical protein
VIIDIGGRKRKTIADVVKARNVKKSGAPPLLLPSEHLLQRLTRRLVELIVRGRVIGRKER